MPQRRAANEGAVSRSAPAGRRGTAGAQTQTEEVMRIYKVETEKDGVIAMVRAESQTKALKAVASAEVATQEDLVDWMKSDGEIQEAK